MSQQSPREIARKVLDFLADQKYQGEEILHAVVCCDFVSREHMVDALAKIIVQAERESLAAKDREIAEEKERAEGNWNALERIKQKWAADRQKIAAQREKLADFIITHSFATGHATPSMIFSANWDRKSRRNVRSLHGSDRLRNARTATAPARMLTATAAGFRDTHKNAGAPSVSGKIRTTSKRGELRNCKKA